MASKALGDQLVDEFIRRGESMADIIGQTKDWPLKSYFWEYYLDKSSGVNVVRSRAIEGRVDL